MIPWPEEGQFLPLASYTNLRAFAQNLGTQIMLSPTWQPIRNFSLLPASSSPDITSFSLGMGIAYPALLGV